MEIELSVALSAGVILIAFVCEYVDSTLGMGYGTTLTPLLLFLGFGPLQIVPAVLLSELVSGLLASFFHHREGNVNFRPKTTDFFIIMRKLSALGYVESFRRGVPLHLRVALLLAACSTVGTIVAVVAALNIPRFWVTLYIGCLVLAMGVIILLCLGREFRFSWKRLTILGIIASFNKGISGGGYGPVVTSGQILSGIESKSAVGITSLAEGLTCLVGVLCYLFAAHAAINWQLAPYLMLGAVCCVPFSAKSVKRMSSRGLTLAIGILTIVLGGATILKTLEVL